MVKIIVVGESGVGKTVYVETRLKKKPLPLRPFPATVNRVITTLEDGTTVHDLGCHPGRMGPFHLYMYGVDVIYICYRIDEDKDFWEQFVKRMSPPNILKNADEVLDIIGESLAPKDISRIIAEFASDFKYLDMRKEI